MKMAFINTIFEYYLTLKCLVYKQLKLLFWTLQAFLRNSKTGFEEKHCICDMQVSMYFYDAVSWYWDYYYKKYLGFITFYCYLCYCIYLLQTPVFFNKVHKVWWPVFLLYSLSSFGCVKLLVFGIASLETCTDMY